MDYYLAIDIGASSGRHMLGHLENGQLVLEEIHRFPNEMKPLGGQLVWDIDFLFAEILAGMKKCADLGKIPKSVGIDTWGVDFVLLDADMNMLGPAVAYRDSRTDGMYEEVAKCISDQELYTRTGIQKMSFNTIYQLMALKKHSPELLENAHALLFLPDYLHYLLSGVAQIEYTVASTSGLIHAKSREWDYEIIAACGFPAHLFTQTVPPGTVLGALAHEIAENVGYNCKVITPASHDTKSAVMAVPAAVSQPLYISSGTWSLLGVELPEPNCSPASQAKNFTNEGGYASMYCYLRNIMGLWIIQCVKKELGDKYSFAELCEMAKATQFDSIIDVNHDSFLAPESMIQAIQAACQPAPQSPGEIAKVVYHSLAISYRDTIHELEELTGKVYDTIYIVGGGSKADYLNELTEKYTGKAVHTGPAEATAIGNLVAQMITDGVFKDLQEARACIRNSL